MRPQILKQHVAGIEVSGLFDLKWIMLSLPLTSIDIISRPFVNGQAILIFRTYVETLIWA